jgi:RNA polymerase sigma-70 factor (ECF subfamily)
MNSSDPFYNNEFQHLFDDLYVPLCRFALKFLNNSSLAEDVVQDTFVYLWENRNRLSFSDGINQYLYTTVRNKSLNLLQKKFIKSVSLLPDDKEIMTIGSKQPTAQELLECKELEKILEDALKSLPEKCRIIFSMKRFGEMTNNEIADKLNISVKTVEAQTTIAIKKLTSYVNNHWNSSSLILFNFLLRKNIN